MRKDKAGNNIFGQCGKTFSTKRGVQLHIGSKHQINPQYKCICSKGFVSNTSYKDHMDKHADIQLKCVKCGMCNAVLFNKQALKDHTIMHCPILVLFAWTGLSGDRHLQSTRINVNWIQLVMIKHILPLVKSGTKLDIKDNHELLCISTELFLYISLFFFICYWLNKGGFYKLVVLNWSIKKFIVVWMLLFCLTNMPLFVDDGNGAIQTKTKLYHFRNFMVDTMIW